MNPKSKIQKTNPDCHAVVIFAVVNADFPSNHIDPFGMT